MKSHHPVRKIRIKICGITQTADLEWMRELGVDSVGINLVPHSSRFVPTARAFELAARAKQLGLATVAVLMDPSPEDLSEIVACDAWDYLQLHGHESPQLLKHANGIPIIKALSWTGQQAEHSLAKVWRSATEGSSEPLQAEPRRCDQELGTSRLAALLVDAYAPGVGGGTGRTARWDLLRPRPVELQGLPLVLAGGLTPTNVGQAIVQSSCDAVDTASGVESSPGVKSPEAVRLLAMEADRALSALGK